MLAYTKTLAGLGFSTAIADMDFEIYSEAGYFFDPIKNKWRAPDGFPQGKAGLQSISAPAYAEHPSTEILFLAYDLKNGQGPKRWHPWDPPPQDLFTHLRNGGLIEAHNSSFEFYIWHYVCFLRLGWPALPLDQLRCSMAKGNAWGLPGKLGKAAEVLNAPEQKDKTGETLIRKLCTPRSPTKNDNSLRLTPLNAPDDFRRLYDYGAQDIKAESAVSQMTPDLLPEELELWKLDQRINTRGVYIDPQGLANCASIIKQARDRYTAELKALVPIPDITIDKLDQIKGWMAAHGFVTSSLDADHVAAALKRKDLPADVYRVLELRATLGAASVKKTAAIERTVSSDGRLRDLFVFHGARQTGRFAGMGAQPQNLPADGPEVCKCGACGRVRWIGLKMCPICYHTDAASTEWGIEAAECALKAISTRDLSVVEALWGDATAAVAGCLRTLFSAAPDHDLICSDYSAIEAVVLAAVAGEEWRLEVFRTHGLIYETCASKITGIPLQEFIDHKKNTGNHHPMRKKVGKIPELASGYQGARGAWKKFGADKFMNDDEIDANVKAWRAASPSIVKLWQKLEEAAVAAVQVPGQCFEYRGISYGVKNDVLYCKLLSGRTLTYHKPRLHNDFTLWGRPILKLTFMGWNSDSTKGPIGWMRRDTYGGKLTENVVQALARDILAHAMLNLDKASYPIVLHVHDEIVSEVRKGVGSIEDFERIMDILPAWCANWPIKATNGWRGQRYRKD